MHHPAKKSSHSRVILSVCALALFGALLAACAKAEPAPYADSGSAFEQAAAKRIPVGASVKQGELGERGERVVLRSATVSVVVEDPRSGATAIGRMADDMGGFVVASSEHRSDYSEAARDYATASIAIRVPASQLDAALERIETQAIEVTHRNISGKDVTQEYTDARSRVRNLEAAEAQLLLVMEKAHRTEGILAVLQRLTDVRAEIEVLQGRIQYLGEASRLALVQVELSKEAPPQVVSAWGLGKTVDGSFHALVSVVQFLSRVLIFVAVVVLPLSLLGFFFLYLPFRLIRRRRVAAGAAG